MKYKIKVCSILFLAILCLLVGIAIAYYNTASLGYDNANIISIYDDRIRIFDITIYLDTIRNIKEFISSFLIPKNYVFVL